MYYKVLLFRFQGFDRSVSFQNKNLVEMKLFVGIFLSVRINSCYQVINLEYKKCETKTETSKKRTQGQS